MRRYSRLWLSAACFQLLTFNLQLSTAQTQSGFVRTVARPDTPSERLQGVVVRVQGDYNPVMTDGQGVFQVLMPEYKNGTAYSLAGISKAGYELREPELVGRQLPFSSAVPLEIVMVSRRQLQRDKQRIEQAARDNIERYYQEQLNLLNEQLTQARISNGEYEEKLGHIEREYERFEPLISQMAERYARTDYQALSSADSLIQLAIEQGNLRLAQRRILAKGDPEERERKMRNIRRMAETQRDELADDYYHLYAIHISRFENDSALYWLLKRAELDTTNAQWQIDAGNFYDKMSRSYDKALVLYRRALRYAIANEGQESLLAAKAHNNVGYMLFLLKRYDEAMPEMQTAAALYISNYGLHHQRTAARLTNIGSLHYYLGQTDSAQVYFSHAEEIYSVLESNPDADKALFRLHAQLLNNQAALDVASGDYHQAYLRLTKGLEILPKDEEYTRLLLLQSAAAVCVDLGQPDEGRQHWQQALELARKLYGAEHDITKEIERNLK